MVRRGPAGAKHVTTTSRHVQELLLSIQNSTPGS
jgi:hypothetical protein